MSSKTKNTNAILIKINELIQFIIPLLLKFQPL